MTVDNFVRYCELAKNEPTAKTLLQCYFQTTKDHPLLTLRSVERAMGMVVSCTEARLMKVDDLMEPEVPCLTGDECMAAHVCINI